MVTQSRSKLTLPPHAPVPRPILTLPNTHLQGELKDYEWDDDGDVAAHSETPTDLDVDRTSTLPTPRATTTSHSPPPNVAGSRPVTAENYNWPLAPSVLIVLALCQ
ncbi:hypothetical protein BU17DRAFT_89707 [Hysterangium stoloniferum]|nr:hypothetical protein BU17DRAFT_89707 [Hysterangium stoloniferum]